VWEKRGQFLGSNLCALGGVFVVLGVGWGDTCGQKGVFCPRPLILGNHHPARVAVLGTGRRMVSAHCRRTPAFHKKICFLSLQRGHFETPGASRRKSRSNQTGEKGDVRRPTLTRGSFRCLRTRSQRCLQKGVDKKGGERQK